MPCPGLLAASNKIDPKIGPIHGVHPAAKPRPIKNVPKNPAGLFEKCIRFSLINVGILIQPATKKPMKIMNTPAIR